MTPLRIDPALHYSTSSESLARFRDKYVEKVLRAGTKPFQQHCDRTKRKLETTDSSALPKEFTCFIMKKKSESIVISDQDSYL